jgi:endonuclease/exonuclease/phosphatase family metal-dependent hydrolase
MKLIQLNIWGGKLQHQIPKFLSEEEPDIVCMQEVHDLKGPSGAVFVTLDEIKQKCGFAYSYMSPTYSSTYQRRANSFGNAILTTWKSNTARQFLLMVNIITISI